MIEETDLTDMEPMPNDLKEAEKVVDDPITDEGQESLFDSSNPPLNK